ncbi:MAG TPA: glycosyltransferase family 2 protein [Azospirillaceae bacterium]|nr:glycosyltransferase family 2 protein [Azospirillaceae bacterium]
MTGLSLENDLQKSGAPKISVVVPVYNEEKNIPHFLARVRPILQEIGPYEILFCLDPSTDRSEQVIAAAAAADPCIGLLVFSRRFGQPAATIAGLMNCRGETCVVIDVDLQDPPEVIPHLYAKLMEGNDVVYARRSSRKGETFIKRAVSAVGYWVINAISDVSIPRNTGDFRIVTRRVIEELRHLKESHGFLRGMVALVGFKQSYVEYDRDPRLEGQGKYNRYLGSLKIGLNGVFGFSTYPLSLMMWTGFFIAIASVFLIFYTVIAKLVIGQEYPVGVPTITVLVLFMGGVQLMALGVLGEYIGRIYEEVRHRPQYIIDRAYNVAPIDHRGPNSGADDRQSRCAVSQTR